MDNNSNFEELTPEEYAHLLQLGGINQGLAEQIKMQMEQSKHLRVDHLGNGRDFGRVTVAPHWMEVIGGLARNKAAQQKDDQVLRTQGNVNANQQIQYAMILKDIIAKRRAAQAAQTPNPAQGLMPGGPGMGLKLPNAGAQEPQLPPPYTGAY